MKKLILFLIFATFTISCIAQVTNKDIEVRKSAPALKLNGIGAEINFYNGDVKITQSSNKITITGGVLDLPANGIQINSTAVTATANQLNYLNAATGTTGTTNTNIVYSASPTTTGTLTTARIDVGGTNSVIDSLLINDDGLLIVYSAGVPDTVGYYIRYADRVNIEDVVSMLADSNKYDRGYLSYHAAHQTLTPKVTDGAALGTSSLMYSDLFLASGGVINHDNGDVTETHKANEIEVRGGFLDWSYANPGDPTILGYNSSTTDLSTGVKGYHYAESGTGVYYGVQGQATGTSSGATKVGVWGDAQGGTYNYAVHADHGDMRIDDNLVLEQDATGTEVTAAGGITTAMLSAYILFNEDSAIDITADPQIANPLVGVWGTVIIIQGSSDVNTLTIDDGTGVQLAAGAQCVLGAGDILALIFNGTDWFELYRANN